MYFDTRAKNIGSLDQALLVFNGKDKCVVRTISSVVYEQHNMVVKHASHQNDTICLVTPQSAIILRNKSLLLCQPQQHIVHAEVIEDNCVFVLSATHITMYLIDESE